MADLVGREQIDCAFEWVPGYLHAPAFGDRDDDAVGRLAAEADLAMRLGFDACFVERVPFLDRPGIRFDDQARLHPLRYVHALRTATFVWKRSRMPMC